MIVSPSSLDIIGIFRDILVTELFVGYSPMSSYYRSDAVSVSFLEIVKYPDLLEALKAVWIWASKKWPQQQKVVEAYLDIHSMFM